MWKWACTRSSQACVNKAAAHRLKGICSHSQAVNKSHREKAPNTRPQVWHPAIRETQKDEFCHWCVQNQHNNRELKSQYHTWQFSSAPRRSVTTSAALLNVAVFPSCGGSKFQCQYQYEAPANNQENLSLMVINVDARACTALMSPH